MNVMYFSAPWCGPCKTFKPVLMEVARDLGINVNDINVDYDAMSTEKYRVSSIPTIVITDNQGNELRRSTGVVPKDQLINMLNYYKQ